MNVDSRWLLTLILLYIIHPGVYVCVFVCLCVRIIEKWGSFSISKVCFAMVNMFSLIPRCVKDTQHLKCMNIVNDELKLECLHHDNVKFINVFSNFLDRKILRQGKVGLNTKLYRKDLIHFSDVGNSVLAKVIIGVTYNPY